TARAGNAAYAATKWGMNGWSEALRQELQPDIRVTVIEPGAVATELTNHIADPAAKQGAEHLYAQLAITPEDVAEVIAFAVTRPRRMTLNEILLRPTAPTGCPRRSGNLRLSPPGSLAVACRSTTGFSKSSPEPELLELLATTLEDAWYALE